MHPTPPKRTTTHAQRTHNRTAIRGTCSFSTTAASGSSTTGRRSAWGWSSGWCAARPPCCVVVCSAVQLRGLVPRHGCLRAVRCVLHCAGLLCVTRRSGRKVREFPSLPNGVSPPVSFLFAQALARLVVALADGKRDDIISRRALFAGGLFTQPAAEGRTLFAFRPHCPATPLCRRRDEMPCLLRSLRACVPLRYPSDAPS